MSIACHIVRVSLKTVNDLGQPVDKTTASIQGMLHTHSEHRVYPSESSPNSANYPTIETYLQAEAADDFILGFMDQGIIVTYAAADINAAS